jgi:chloride channel protein, CIC family
MPSPIFDVLTRQDGVELPSMEEQREEGILRVEDAMQPAEVVLDGQQNLRRVSQEANKASGDILLVRLSPSGWGSVKKSELRKMLDEGKGEFSLSSLLTMRQIPFLHPDNALETALRYVDRWPLVPVVSRADFRKLEGVISERDVLERYREFGEG